MIDKAIEFATKAHEGQYRKGTKRPYIVHPVEVGDIVATMTDDEEVISAAVLHDTIEAAKALLREFWPRNSLSGWPSWSPRKVKISQRPGWSESVLPLSISAQPPGKCR